MSFEMEEKLIMFGTQQNLQLKLSDLLANPPSTYIIQSDCAIISIREGSTIDIILCNPGFTTIEHYFSVDGVTALADIRVRYNADLKQIALVYRARDRLCFQKGKVPLDKNVGYRSTISNHENLSVQFINSETIIAMSEIILSQAFGNYCIITSSSGRTYLLRHLNNSLTVNETNPSSRLYGFFKTILKPLTTQPTYTSCNTFTYAVDNCGIYCLNLLGSLLQMKFFNLANQNSYQEINSWEVDLGRSFLPGSAILNSLFLYQVERANWHGVNLILLCLVEGRVDMYIVSVDFNTKIKGIQLTKDVINPKVEQNKNDQQSQSNEGNSQQQNDSQMIPEQAPIAFSKDFDYFQLEYYNGKIFVIFHQKILNSNTPNQRVCMLMLVKRVEDQLILTEPRVININGELRMVGLGDPADAQEERKEKNKFHTLLLVGEAYCYSFHQNQESNNFVQMQPTLQNIFLSLPGRSRKLPPIPSFDEQTKKSSQKLEQRMSNKKENKSGRQQNVYSKRNLQKYLFCRNYFQLFSYLESLKQNFLQELQEVNILEMSANDAGRIPQQLETSIILKLFTLQNGSQYTLDEDLVDQIFNENILVKKFEGVNDKHFQFLRNIFLIETNSDYNQSRELNLIFKVLLQTRNYTGLYNVCVEIIPNFVENIVQRFNTEIEQSMQDSKAANDELQRLKQTFALSYLNLYEELIMKLNFNYMAMEGVPPHKTKKKSSENMDETERKMKNHYIDFSQYHHKQLLTKYLQMKCLTSSPKLMDNSTMLQIVRRYLKNYPKYANFFTTMAIQFKNITLFDEMLRSRLVTKNDVAKFVNQNVSRSEKQKTLRIFINLIETQIKKIASNTKDDTPSLNILSWIPASSAESIFQYLMENHPNVAILYGLTFKNRRELAAQLAEKADIFDTFTSPKLVLELIDPFYTCKIESQQLKINADLARLFLQNKLDFKSYNKLISPSQRKNEKIKGDSWIQLMKKLSKYLPIEKISQLEQNFTLI